MKGILKNQLAAYFVNSFNEFKKVTWPTKEQAIMLTGIVIGFSLVMAIVIGVFDLGLSEGYRSLLKLFNQ